MSKVAVVTGGSGFLGRKVSDRLRGSGYRVHQMAMPGEEVEGEWFFRGNICDAEEISFPRNDLVVHCAGILESSHPTDEMMFRVNYQGTVNAYNEGAKKGMSKFIMISTVSAIGPRGTREKGMTEDTEPGPNDAYGRSKLKAERFLEERSREDNIDIIILRPTVLYGDGMNLHSSGMKTFTSINRGIMPLVGKGDTIFNLLYVENFIHAIMLAVERGTGFRIYNVSEGPYTLREVIETIERRLGKKGHRRIPKPVLYLLARFFTLTAPLLKGPPPVSMAKYQGLTTSVWHLDSSLIARELGFKPPFTLEEGVERTIVSYGWDSNTEGRG